MSYDFIHDKLDNPFCNFTKYFCIGSFKTLHSSIALSTLARRLINEQTIFHTDSNLNKNLSAESTPSKKGFFSGYTLGAIGVLGYTLNEASNKNYLPLGILALSNIVNFGHEFMRLSEKGEKKLEDKINL